MLVNSTNGNIFLWKSDLTFFFLMLTLYITAVGLGESFNKVETMCFLFHSMAKVSHSSVLSLPNLVVN